MARKKSREELLAENRMLRASRATDGWVSFGNNLVRWGGLVLISFFLYRTVAALAGRLTFADIRILGNMGVNRGLMTVLCGGSVWYGYAQRKLRRETVERLQKRNEELEKARDSRRSSSKLTPRGETNPEDAV